MGRWQIPEETESTEDEMVGWHHRLNGKESEQTGDTGGQRSLVRRSPWGRKQPGTARTQLSD